MCMLCYCCLIRPKEIALLKCSDFDLKKQTVRVRAEMASIYCQRSSKATEELKNVDMLNLKK